MKKPTEQSSTNLFSFSGNSAGSFLILQKIDFESQLLDITFIRMQLILPFLLDAHFTILVIADRFNADTTAEIFENAIGDFVALDSEFSEGGLTFLNFFFPVSDLRLKTEWNV